MSLRRAWRRTIGLPSLEPRVVWIFGSPRSGSTWLLNLLRVDPRVVTIDEPGIAAHLGAFVPQVRGMEAADPASDHLTLRAFREGSPDYFFSSRYEHAWRGPLRRLILERIGAQLEEAPGRAPPRRRIAVLKEPHGSQVADTVVSVLPRSRLIFMLRDGRDVIDSQLDAARPGSWGIGEQEMAGGDRLSFVEGRAHVWLYRTEAVQRAFDRMPAHNRLLVRYEELRADTVGAMAPVIEWLGAEVGRAELESICSRLAFEALPDDQRGSGRFARAATPGLWRENLTDAERRAIESIIGPKLVELGYARD